MKISSQKWLPAFALLSLWSLVLVARAQTTTEPEPQLKTEVQTAIGFMRAEKSNEKLLACLAGIQPGEERATQMLLASINTLDLPELRKNVITSMFKLPYGENGLNIRHLPLLVELYVKSVKKPITDFQYTARRSFYSDFVIQSKLTDKLAHMLKNESLRWSIPAGEPLSRLIWLLEAARGTGSLSALVLDKVENALVALKKAKDEVSPNKQATPEVGSTALPSPQHTSETPNQASHQQPPAPNKESEIKPTDPLHYNKPPPLFPWQSLAMLLATLLCVAWLVLKRRS